MLDNQPMDPVATSLEKRRAKLFHVASFVLRGDDFRDARVVTLYRTRSTSHEALDVARHEAKKAQQASFAAAAAVEAAPASAAPASPAATSVAAGAALPPPSVAMKKMIAARKKERTIEKHVNDLEVVAVEDVFDLLWDLHYDNVSEDLRHVGSKKLFKNVGARYSGINRLMCLFITRTCITCDSAEAVKTQKVHQSIV